MPLILEDHNRLHFGTVPVEFCYLQGSHEFNMCAVILAADVAFCDT